MAEPDDAPEIALPAPNPDAQTTVNDFLDYTEFFPSDLVRSLTLIGDLDSTYRDAVQQVHELTVLYGKLPSIPGQERPDPTLLRKQIAQNLQKAINQREYAFAEASRLYEVTVRHCQRSSIIKKKLQAQPEPPSRDPTPPPVSPSAQRSYQRTYERPAHLRLTFDGGRHGASAARSRDRHRKIGAHSRRRAHSTGSDSSDGDSGGQSVDVSPRKQKQRDRAPKPGRTRPPGVLGTNVHSSIAGISTSNALALLAPPPPDAQPGSRWAPWMKLTEYEMAVLRKQMKKNAVWTPSLTMVNRELERKHRTRLDYEREKARCEIAGEEMLDEEPESLQQIMHTSSMATAGPAVDEAEPSKEGQGNEGGTFSIRIRAPVEGKGSKSDRVTQRAKAEKDAKELENATAKVRQAADGLKELTFTPQPSSTPASQRRRTSLRAASKRKRDSSPIHDDGNDFDREGSDDSDDSSTRNPEPKRLRLQLNGPEPDTDDSLPSSPLSDIASPKASNPSRLSPIVQIPYKETADTMTNGSTVQVPLAPAGPSTPRASRHAPKEPSQPSTPGLRSSKEAIDAEGANDAGGPAQQPAQPTVTAASSRPRRESVAPKAPSPADAQMPPLKSSKASTPDLKNVPQAPVHVTRPRSARGHVPTPKAQSEEPTPHEAGRVTREGRRHSVFSQSALTAPVATRMSTRKKPPPKGEVTAENGQKTVTNVKRAQGNKNKKKTKAEEEAEQDDVDPSEPRYCFCDDISYGSMISCDNNCEREWFHLPCVGMNDEDLPSRRAKWYCPACRELLRIDAYGNPLVPPPLPGRRGNR